MVSYRIGSMVLLAISGASSFAQGACVVSDANFASAGGGCKDLRTGVVWSPDMRAQGLAYNPSSGSIGIADVQVWCNNNLNTQPEGGGFTDWRAPTLGEVQEALANGLNSHLDFFNDGGATPDDSKYRYTLCKKKVQGASNTYAIRYTDGNVKLTLTGGDQLICVRGQAADPANDCPGPGKKNNKSVAKIGLSQTSTGALLLFPLGLVIAARCLQARRP
jgi:hypothetical protein